MAIYMQFDDQSVLGDVTDQGTPQTSGASNPFKGCIELSSMQWGVGRAIGSANTASEADRESCLPTVSEIVVTKGQDSSSGNLMRAACAAPKLKQAKLVYLYIVSAGDNGSSDYISYKLENCLVSGWSQSSGGDRPSESLTLNFTKITFNYANQAVGTSQQGPDSPYYDLAQQLGG
jgi:type VI secretion system secreted protein Hcp